MKKKALGRGLEALLPDLKKVELAANEIDIDRIIPNPNQPRLKLDEVRLQELAASIRANGVLQPILVRPHADGYQLVAGERRLAAAQRAGLLKIPARVQEVPDDRLLEIALVENIQREPLNPLEEAQAYQRLMETTHKTQEQIAEQLGKDRSTIANAIRLLKLPPAVKLLVADGKLSAGHARALLASDVGPAEMARIAALIVEKDWSVRETEHWAKKKAKPVPPSSARDPNEAAAEDKLRLVLGTKVQIRSKSKERGEIRIHYYSQDELMRIYSILTGEAIATESGHAIHESKNQG